MPDQSTTDAVEMLLRDIPDSAAQSLLTFHRRNRTFLLCAASELLWLKKLGRKADAGALFHFLRWVRHWNALEDEPYEVNQNYSPLAGRVVTLLWPDTRGTLGFLKCPADDALGTVPVGRSLRAKKALREKLKTLPPAPVPPKLTKAATAHPKITTFDCAEVVRWFAAFVASRPDPRHSLLRRWLRHVQSQPEIFVLAERTYRLRRPPAFSAVSFMDYGLFSVNRAVETVKPFHGQPDFEGLYSTSLVLRNIATANGHCLLKRDYVGKQRSHITNQLLGTSIASEPLPGEPYCRLVETIPFVIPTLSTKAMKRPSVSAVAARKRRAQ